MHRRSQSNVGKGGGRPSWARGGVLIGGLMAAMTLLNNAAFFSSRGQQHSSHRMKGPEGLPVQPPLFTDVIDQMFRLRDTWAGGTANLTLPHTVADPHIHASSSSGSERAKIRLRAASLRASNHAASSKATLHASKPILSEILDESLSGATSAAKKSSLAKPSEKGQVQAAPQLEEKEGEIEEEPSHAGQGIRQLTGVGGADLPCPGKTQGPDAGACQIPCGGGDCRAATSVCENIRGCIGYTLNREGTWATLKGRVRWVKPETPTPNYERCKRILRGQSQLLHEDGQEHSWDSLWCPDFVLEEHYNGVSAPSYVMPTHRRSLYDRSLRTDKMVCPKPIDNVLILTFQNGPSGDLCRFLHLASRFGLHVNVIGWEPDVNKRWKEFYMGSKVVTTLFLLNACQYPPDTVIVFSDTDVLIQGGMVEIKKALTQILPQESEKRLVMATELSLEVAPNHAGRFADLAPADAIYKNLNSGGYAGRADTLEAFLKEVGSGRAYNTPGAKRFDGSVPELYRARLKHNSDGIPTVYHVNDQATFAEVLHEDMFHHRVTFDYKVELFQSMFGRPAHGDLSLKDGRLENHRAHTVPVFVHYNGMAKDPGHVPETLDAKALYRSLVNNVAPQKGGDVWQAFEESVTFLDPAYQVAKFDAKAVCESHI